MAQASMPHPTPDVHLKRAFGFLQQVEKATEEFQQRAITYGEEVDSDKPFLEGTISTIRGSRRLRQQKAALTDDLRLAEQEVNQAAAIDATAEIHTEHGSFGTLQFRAQIMFKRGQIEVIWGSTDTAAQLFKDCIQILEFANPHYMLGLIYEAKYMPAQALWHFERCLQLDPAGEFSVPALREANAMRNYKKRFRGDWRTFCFLLLIWPAAIIYFFVNRK